MTREEMLNILHQLRCKIFWPGNWNDIGFTEQQMWVNNKGYGYFSCDEPNITYELAIPENWQEIINKLKNHCLTLKDIEGTSLEELYCFEYEETDVNEVIKDLLSLKHEPEELLFCIDTFDGFRFFETQEEFEKARERDWCDCEWDDLPDSELSLWIERFEDGSLDE